MESMEVLIANFINPHLFFLVTDLNASHRSNFLQELSLRIKKSLTNMHDQSFHVDEMVAVSYNSQMVRGIILDVAIDQKKQQNLYACWLVDHAVLLKTETVFKLPKQLQKVTPRIQQACLKDIFYVKDHLELGLTGKITKIPSLTPSSGIVNHCLDILSDHTQLIFNVVEKFGDIFIGDLKIHKNNQVIDLTEELCKRGLIFVDENYFQRIKYSISDYIKTHTEHIYSHCKPSHITAPKETPKSCETSIDDFQLDEEDLDMDDLVLSPLENGRRRKISNKSPNLNTSQTASSEKSPSAPLLTKMVSSTPIKENNTLVDAVPPENKKSPMCAKLAQLLQKREEHKALKEAQKSEAFHLSGGIQTALDVRKKMALLRKMKANLSGEGKK